LLGKERGAGRDARRTPVALQRQRRKRDRGKREEDDRVIRLEDQQRGQQDGDRGEGGEQDRDQESRARKQDEDEEPRQQEEGSQAEEDQDVEPQDRERASEDESRDRDEGDEDEDRSREDRRSEPLPALEILDAAKDQLTVLTGRVPDSVSGLRRSDNGWRMKIDMVELERIPPSTSVMATYEVELDRDGNVVGYEQERRFVRGQADD
jgi:hypothetical protein